MKSILSLHICISILSTLLFFNTTMLPLQWFYFLGLLITVGGSSSLFIFKHNQYKKALTLQEMQVENIKDITKKKQDFISKISHDLRTPIHGINGLIELLEKEPLGDLGKSYLLKLKFGSNALLDLVSDVIELNRPEVSDIQTHNEEVNLTQLSEEIIQLYSTNCFLKKIQLSLFIEPAIYGKNYSLDKNKLKKILTNLVSNAIKFTDAGEVTLWIKETVVHKETSKLTFMVTDTGVGITEEHIALLTQPYYQVHSSKEDRIEGTGLGLNICLNLLKSMRSELTIRSTKGVGSQFRFNVEANSKTNSHTLIHKIKENKKVVLLSQKSVTTENILNYLEYWQFNYQYIECHQIKELKTHIDLLVIQGFSEAELTTLIPKVSALDLKSIHILLDSDTKIIEQQFHNKRLHFDYGYFSPIVLHKFLEEADVMHKHLSTNPPEIDYIKLLKGLTKGHITSMLVVDDNEINQLVLTEMLQEAGINKIEVANNGLEAVELSLKSNYDIIWMDLMMPIMDGYSATKEILKQKPYTSIYGLSAATEPEVIVKGKQCGMQAVIGKPLKKADLYTHLINYYDSLNNPSKTANTLDLKSLFNKEEPLKVLIHTVDSRTTFKLKQYFEEQDNVLTTYISDPDSIIYVCQIQAYDLLLVDLNDNKSRTAKFIHEYVTKRQTTPLILVNTEQQNYLHQSNTLIRFLPLNFNALDIQKVLLHFKEESKTVFINKPTSSQKEYYNEL